MQVLLPVHNAGAFLDESIPSILAQTLEDFELLIIDDASIDNSRAIIQRYAEQDSRIRLIENQTNQGIIETRNQLFRLAEADYLALMDADDICHPQRLAKQRQFLQDNEPVAAVGCAIEHFGDRDGCYFPPRQHEQIMAGLTFGNAMLNPGVTVRREALRRHGIECDAHYRGAADYDMWLRLGKVERLANLPEVLFRYRNHAVQESSANQLRQQGAHLRIVQRELALLDIEARDEWLRPLFWPLQYWQSADLKAIGRLVSQVLWASRDGHSWWCQVDPQELFRMWDFNYRGLCRRHGFPGLISYLGSRGLRSMARGKNCGLNFALDCFMRTT